MYVANRASNKISQLADNVYVCRSGSVSVLYFCRRLGTFSCCLSHFYCDIQLFEDASFS
uniref:Uncharacterized protein n=1 Tax=Triticum urartu TaxID=4572 RepID=A0A8R7PZ76_TRIUA